MLGVGLAVTGRRAQLRQVTGEGFPVRSCYRIWGYRAGPVGRQMPGVLLRVGVPWRGLGLGRGWPLRPSGTCPPLPEQWVLQPRGHADIPLHLRLRVPPHVFLPPLQRQVEVNVRNKILYLIQAWAHAFRNEPKYKVVQDTYQIMKVEGESAGQCPHWVTRALLTLGGRGWHPLANQQWHTERAPPRSVGQPSSRHASPCLSRPQPHWGRGGAKQHTARSAPLGTERGRPQWCSRRSLSIETGVLVLVLVLVLRGRGAWGLVHLAARGDCSLLSPGHVFPEFKESDAMFAAERVSLWCRERGLLWGGPAGTWATGSCCLRGKQRPAWPSGVSGLWLAGSRLRGTGLSPRPLRLVFRLRGNRPRERAPPAGPPGGSRELGRVLGGGVWLCGGRGRRAGRGLTLPPRRPPTGWTLRNATAAGCSSGW